MIGDFVPAIAELGKSYSKTCLKTKLYLMILLYIVWQHMITVGYLHLGSVVKITMFLLGLFNIVIQKVTTLKNHKERHTSECKCNVSTIGHALNHAFSCTTDRHNQGAYYCNGSSA